MESLDGRKYMTIKTRRFVSPNCAISDVQATAGRKIKMDVSAFATRNVWRMIDIAPCQMEMSRLVRKPIAAMKSALEVALTLEGILVSVEGQVYFAVSLLRLTHD